MSPGGICPIIITSSLLYSASINSSNNHRILSVSELNFKKYYLIFRISGVSDIK